MGLWVGPLLEILSPTCSWTSRRRTKPWLSLRRMDGRIGWRTLKKGAQRLSHMPLILLGTNEPGSLLSKKEQSIRILQIFSIFKLSFFNSLILNLFSRMKRDFQIIKLIFIFQKKVFEHFGGLNLFSLHFNLCFAR